MTEFAAAAAPDAESVLVARGLGDLRGLASLVLLVALGELVALAELVALGELVAVCFALLLLTPLGVALTLRVLPPALAAVDEVDSVGVAGVCIDGAVDVGDCDVGVGAPSVVGWGSGRPVLGGGGGVAVGVGIGTGELEWVGDGLDWDFKSSHCWLVPVTTDATLADTAAEAPDVPDWSAEATKE